MKSLSSTPRRHFLQQSSLLVGSLALRPWSTRAADHPEGVPAQRLEKLATGANVCRWFRYPRRDTTEHFESYISDAEASVMADIGLRHVRLCIHPQVLMDPATGVIHEPRALQLEAALRRFHRAGLLVVVDLHNEDRAFDTEPARQEAFIRFWSVLSKRLSRFDPDLTVLEVINEPVFQGRESDWNHLNLRLITAMREGAPHHTLMTTGPNWGGIDGLQKLEVLADRNVVYSFHCYDPFPFTHQGATWSSEEVKPLRGVPYPSSPEAVAPLLPGLADHPRSQRMLERYGNERWNQEKLAARFQQAVAWGARHRVPLYCGEFGVFPPHSQPEHRAHWFRDFGQVLTAQRIGWAVWGWDEGFGLNRRMVDGKPVVDAVVAKALGLKTTTPSTPN